MHGYYLGIATQAPRLGRSRLTQVTEFTCTKCVMEFNRAGDASRTKRKKDDKGVKI